MIILVLLMFIAAIIAGFCFYRLGSTAYTDDYEDDYEDEEYQDELDKAVVLLEKKAFRFVTSDGAKYEKNDFGWIINNRLNAKSYLSKNSIISVGSRAFPREQIIWGEFKVVDSIPDFVPNDTYDSKKDKVIRQMRYTDKEIEEYRMLENEVNGIRNS